MGPLFLAALVAYYVVYRFGDDLIAAAGRVTAKAADAVAGLANRLDRRAHGDPGESTMEPAGEEVAPGQTADGGTSAEEPVGNSVGRPAARTTAGRVRDRARATAAKLRSRPAPTKPRTAAGQRLLREAGEVAAGGLGVFVVWVRLVWVDAAAAAESAQQRRAQGQQHERRRSEGHQDEQRRSRWTPPRWMHWPTGDDPQAPVQATAERLDRNDTADQASSTEPAEGRDEESVIDAEVVEDPETTPPALPAPTSADPPGTGGVPQLSATPVAALPASKSGGQNMSVDTTAAESGLGAYISFSQAMATGCDNAVNNSETTLANLTDQDWSGVPVDAITNAMEHLAAARDEFNRAHQAFEAALNVRDAYSAHNHAGTKDSVMAD